MKGLEYGTTCCMTTTITPPKGSKGSPPGFGGIDLVVTTLWKGVIDNKFIGIFTSGSTTIGFMAP